MSEHKTEVDAERGLSVAALRKREEIKAVAKQLFAEHGFAATSIRQIAARVNLESGSLYYHFPDKLEILYAILDEGNRELLDMVDRVFETDDASAPGRLRQLILGHVRILAKDPARFMVVVRELGELNGLRQARIMTQRKRYEKIVQDLLTSGINDGTLRDCNVKVVSFGLISLLNGVAFWFRPHGAASIDEIGEEYARALLDGLRI
jgi:AcrR family transcriptional regulator